MSESKLKRKPEELIQAEQLVVEGKFEEAHKLMAKIKERGEITLKSELLCNLLKTDIMIQQGLYEDAIKLANQTYNASLELRENVLAFDALNFETKALLWLSRSEEVLTKIKVGEELLRNFKQELPEEFKLRESAIEFLKAWFYFLINDKNRTIEHKERSLKLREELCDKRDLAEILIAGSWAYFTFTGEFDLALQNIERGLTIAKEINWKHFIAVGFQAKGYTFHFKGDFNQSNIFLEKSLNILKNLNNKSIMASVYNNMGWNYVLLGDLTSSSKYLKKSLGLNRELGYNRNTAELLINIIINSIEINNLKEARQYFYELEEMEISTKDKIINLWYRYVKALLLKTSLRAPNRGEAEVILKQIIDEKVENYELNVWTLLNLSELLLIELSMLNDVEVLEELKTVIAQLLNLAEKSRSYYLLTEIYFLKGKLALLTLDTKEARKSLTQAHRIAERWGYNQLATKISQENNKLHSQLNMWNELNTQEISLSERIKLAGMDEQIEHLLRNRVSLTTQVKEKQITVHKERKVCIVCKGDIFGFMYTCKCDALYCEKCARALTDIENVCWVCNTAIDITKAIKPYKKEDIEVKDEKKDGFISKR